MQGFGDRLSMKQSPPAVVVVLSHYQPTVTERAETTVAERSLMRGV